MQKREPPDPPSHSSSALASRHLQAYLWAMVSLNASDRMSEARFGVPVGTVLWNKRSKSGPHCIRASRSTWNAYLPTAIGSTTCVSWVPTNTSSMAADQ